MEQNIRKYQTAGEVVSQEDPFGGGVDLSKIDPNELMGLINAAQARAGAPVTASSYEQSFDKYAKRLQPYTYRAPRMNIYDVASELGAAILATPATGNAFAGIGQGFSGVSNRIRQNQEANQKLNQQVAMQAASMAMQDEKSANDYLQKYSLEMLKLANDPGDLITIEFDEMIPQLDESGQPVLDDNGVQAMVATGERKQGGFRDNASSQATIDRLLREQNGVKVTSPSSISNVSIGNEADRPIAASVIASEEQILADARAADGIRDQVAYARSIAARLGPDNFGAVPAFTQGIRNIMVGVGAGYLVDESILDDQKVLNMLGINFTMAIVAKTKGAISNREMEMFQAASPTLASTYGGFMKQLEYLDRIAEREQQFARDYSAEAGRLEGEGASWSTQKRTLFDFQTTWVRENPLFSPTESDDLRAMQGQNVAADFNYRDQINVYDQARLAATQQPSSTQSGIDATTLALAKSIAEDGNLTLAQRQEKLQGMVSSGLNVPDYMMVNFTLTPKED
jgi:hypothetical protein